MATNPINYLKNIGKSIAYSAVDIGKSYSPAGASLIETNEVLFKSVYSAISTPKSSLNKVAGAIKGSKIYEAGDLGYKAIMEDLRTGNFYNKERINRVDMEAMGSLGDMGGFEDYASFDDMENDIDMNFDDDFSITDGDKMVSDIISETSLSSAEAISNTVAKSGHYVAESNKSSIGLLYTQNANAFSAFNNGITAINENISSVLNFANTTLKAHAENSLTFFEKTTPLLQEQTAILKNILEIQASMVPKKKQESSKKKISRKYDDLVDFEGMLNFEAYGKMVYKNFMSATGLEQMLGMGDFGEGSNIFKTFAASPLKVITDVLVKKLIPDTLDKTINSFNESLKGFFGSLLLKITSFKVNENPILAKIGEIFGLDNSMKTTLDTSKYEKGSISFDGITKKAIVEVIPEYLSRIESALTGNDQRVFDSEQGKFVNKKNIEKERKKKEKSYENNATSDMRSIFSDYENKLLFSSMDDEKEFKKDMNKFFSNMYKGNKFFNPNNNKLDKDDFGISDEMNFSILKAMFKSSPRSTQMAINGKILQERSSYDKYMRDLEEKGNSIYANLDNNSNEGSLKSYNENDKIKNDKTLPFTSSLINQKDNYGKNIFYYLQRQLGELISIRKNKKGSNGSGGNDSSDTDISYLGSILKTDKDREVESDRSKNISFDNKRNKRIQKDKHGSLLNVDNLKDIKNPNSYLRSSFENVNASKDLKAELYKQKQKEDSFFYGLFQDPQKAKERKKNLPSNGNLVDKLLEAKTLGDKSAILMDSFNKLLKKPAEIVNKVVASADESLYNLVYGGNKVYHVDGQEVKGFLDAMLVKLKGTFSKFNTWLDEKILDPIKKKLDIETLSDLLNKITTTFFGMTTKEISAKVREFFFGNDEKDGILSGIKNGIKETFNQFFGFIKNAFKDVYGPLFGKIKNWGKKDKEPLGLPAPSLPLPALPIPQLALPTPKSKKEKDPDSGDQLALPAPNDDDIVAKYRGTRMIKKSGLAVISEGEMIIPSELNPFYNKSTNKKEQISKENNIRNNFISKLASRVGPHIPGFASGITSTEKELQDGETSDDRLRRLADQVNARKLKAKEMAIGAKDVAFEKVDEAKNFAQEMASTFSEGMKRTSNELFGEPGKTDNGKKFAEAIGEVTSKISEYAPTGIGGALIGGGISLISGAIGGPLLGAAVGAGTSIVLNSDKMQEWLFGGTISQYKEGKEFEGGVVPKSVMNGIAKYVPDIAKFGTVGAITAMIPFIPGGPVAGLMIGATAGFIKNNTEVQKALFGEDGLEKFQERVDKALPAMGLGAIGGLILGGPFGFVGNAMLGSAIGFLTTTDTFQTLMFGEENDKGERDGGLLKEIRIAVIDPLKEFGSKFKKNVLDFIRDELAAPLKRAIKPIAKQFEIAITSMFSFVGNTINAMFEKTIGVPLNRLITEKIIDPFTKIFGRLFKTLTGPAKFIISSPFKAIGAVGDSLRERQIKKGNADYMSAEERVKFRKDKKTGYDRYNKFDQIMASMNNEELEGLLTNLSYIKDTSKFKKDARSSEDKLGKGLSQFMPNSEGYRTSDITELSALIKTGNKKEISKYVNGMKNIPEDDKDKLAEFINKQGNDYLNKNKKASDLEGSKKDLYKKLRYQGFDDLDDKSINKYIKYTDKEIGFRNTKDMDDPLEADRKKTEKFRVNILDSLNVIVEKMKKIADPSFKTKDDIENEAKSKISVDDLVERHSVKKNKKLSKTQFTDFGPMKYFKDKTGDDIPDLGDTDTRMSLDKRDDFHEDISTISKNSGFLSLLGGLFGKGKNGKDGTGKDGKGKNGAMAAVGSVLGTLGALGFVTSGDASKVTDKVKDALGYSKNAIGDKEFGANVAKAALIYKLRGGNFNVKGLKKIPLIGKPLSFALSQLDKPFEMAANSKIGSSILGSNAVKAFGGSKEAQTARSVFQGSVEGFKNTGGMKNIGITDEVVKVAEELKSKGLAVDDEIAAAKKIVNKEMTPEQAIAAIEKRNNSKFHKFTSKAGELGTKIKEKPGKVINEGFDAIKSSKLVEWFNKIHVNLINTSKNGSFIKRMGTKGILVFTDKIIPAIMGLVKKAIVSPATAAKFMGKSTAKILAKGIGMPLFIVAGFIGGLSDANRILGIKTIPTQLESLVAGLVRGLNQILFGLIPENVLVNLFFKFLGPVFGLENTDIGEKREDLQEEVDKYNKENETDLTVKEYQEEQLGQGGTFAARTSKMIGETIENLTSGITKFFSDDKFREQIMSDIGKSLKKTFNKIGEVFKDVFDYGKEIVFDPLMDGFLLATHIKKGDYWDLGSDMSSSGTGMKESIRDIIALIGRFAFMSVYYIFEGIIWIKDKIVEAGKNLGDKIMSWFGNINKTNDKLNADISKYYKRDTSIDGYWKNTETGGMGTFLFWTNRLLNFVPVLIVNLFNKVRNFFQPVIDWFGDLSAISKFSINGAMKYINKDGWDNYLTSPFDGGISDIVFYVNRTFCIVPVLIGKLFKTASGPFEEFKNWISGLAQYQIKIMTDTKKYYNKSGWDGYMTTNETGMRKFMFYANRITSIPAVIIHKLFDDVVGKVFEDFKNWISGLSQYQVRITENTKTYYNKSGWDGYMTTNETGLKKFMFYANRIISIPAVTVRKLFGGETDVFGDFKNWISGLAQYQIKVVADTKKYYTKDGWDGYMTTDQTGMKKYMFYGIRVMSAPRILVGKLMNMIGDFFGGFSMDEFLDMIVDKIPWLKKTTNGASKLWNSTKNGASKLWNGTKDFFNLNNSMETINGGKSGLAPINQIDERVSNDKFGNSTIGKSGCAPSTAAMLLNQNFKQVDIKDTAKYATQYQTKEGGINYKYFKNVFGRYGYDTDVEFDNKNLSEKIASGQQVILLGQDIKNKSKLYSPFGPKPHYVVANGIDKNGMVIVRDPESNDEMVYDQSILNNTSMNVSIKDSKIPSMRKKNEKNKGFPLEKNIIEKLKPNIRSYVGDGAFSTSRRNLKVFIPLTDKEINDWIDKKLNNRYSRMRGKGSIINKASKESGYDPRYLVAHMAQEAGWGLNSGIAMAKNNFFGATAYDNSPMTSAQSWSSVNDGIVEGAKWVSRNFYAKGYTSLYTMIYPGGYATAKDSWINAIANIMDGAPRGSGNEVDNSKGVASAPISTNASPVVPTETSSNDSFADQFGKSSTNIFTPTWSDSFKEFASFFGSSNPDEPSSETAQQYNNNSNNSKGSIDYSSTNYSSAKDWYAKTLKGSRVTSNFGYRNNPTGPGTQGHRGTDFGAPSGTEILTPISGTVIESSLHNSYGNHVQVKDNSGGVHVFAHMKTKSKLTKGTKVSKGDLIGYVGSTGNSTGPHLHYETRNSSGTPVNADYYLSNYNGGNSGLLTNMIKPLSKKNKDDKEESGGKGGTDNDMVYKLINSIISILVKLLDDTSNLSQIYNLLVSYFEMDNKIKSGKSSDLKTDKKKKSETRESIVKLINTGSSGGNQHSNQEMVLKQLEALAME